MNGEQIEQWRAEGLLPEDIPGEQFEEVPAEEDSEGAFQAPLSPAEFEEADPVQAIRSGQTLLTRYETEAPTVQDPLMKRFQELALDWLPTGDKNLKTARDRASHYADRLAEIRSEAEERAAQFPWQEFSLSLLAPRDFPTPITTSLGLALRAAATEKERRRQEAEKMKLTEAELLARQARGEERTEMERIRTGVGFAEAAARMQNYASRYAKQSSTTAFGRQMMEMGLDPNNPDHQSAIRRLWLMKEAKGDPAAIRTLLTNPDLDPLTPEFAAKLAETQTKAMTEKEQKAVEKEEREVRRFETHEKVQAARLAETNLRIKQLTEKAKQVQEGKPLSVTGANVILGNQESIRRADLALRLLQGKTVGGTKGDREAVGWKGLMWDPVLHRLDPKGAPTRAAIADLGSLVIHERSGAAVTAAEFPRLRPFIPSMHDSPEVARQKLIRFVQEYKMHQAETIDFFRESGYKIPVSALRGLEALTEGEEVEVKKTEPEAKSGEVRRYVPKEKRWAIFGTDKKFIRWE